jgi:hypothetical protein
MSFSAQAKRYSVCTDLKESITYPKAQDSKKMKAKILFYDSTFAGIKEISKIVVTAGLGFSGLPISVGFNLLFKGLQLAGIEIGQNRRQMLATIIVSEALVNETLNVNGHFDIADIMIFKDFLSAKKEFYKYVKRKEKKEGIQPSPQIFSNIEFAKIVVDLDHFNGYLQDDQGKAVHIDSKDFYCKKFKSGKVKFRGFNRKAKALLYSFYKNLKIKN